MDQSELVIYADYGEERSGIPDLLRNGRVSLVVQELEVGDYILSDRVAVERKTADDFLSSIIKKRLFKQIVDLKESYEKPLFIIEGYLLYGRRKIHPDAIRGALALIAVVRGIPVLFTKDSTDTAGFLRVIAKQEQSGLKHYVSLHAKKKAKNTLEQQVHILEAFPGIGPQLARVLLSHFGGIEKVVYASEDDLQCVEGVGRKKAESIRRILSGENKK
ncbi:MAG: ERCC4 domain-containing protein [Actinomycetota bacterium]|nr:ERCC4 domain-containing protein [Actinomycetota bacterium]